MIQGRLIVDAAAPGDWNMAVDQALLEEVDAGGPATLRFYAWDQPTLSLGYFQRAEQRNAHAESGSAALVRRATGGGAILHDAELTYSLCLPIRDRASARVRLVYDAVHRAIIAALADFGIPAVRFADSADPAPLGPESFLCFQRRTDEDLMLAGYKIAGSAQRRAAAAVLQHGSVLLSASPLAPQLPGIFQLASASLSETSAFESLATRITFHAGLELGTQWDPGAISSETRERAAQIAEHRFAADSWTRRR